MSSRAERWVAIVTIAAFIQTGCYTTYFISKDELKKLESGVEVKEVVDVYGDCPSGQSVAMAQPKEGPRYAQAESNQAEEEGEGESGGDEGTESSEQTASDATPPEDEQKGESVPAGCSKVPVSTGNALNVVLDNGEKRRVTPFNFMMSEQQLVAPEYDLLVSTDRVKGAEVREFSTWKTIGMIAGVSAVTIGTFVGISLTSDEQQF